MRDIFAETKHAESAEKKQKKFVNYFSGARKEIFDAIDELVREGDIETAKQKLLQIKTTDKYLYESALEIVSAHTDSADEVISSIKQGKVLKYASEATKEKAFSALGAQHKFTVTLNLPEGAIRKNVNIIFEKNPTVARIIMRVKSIEEAQTIFKSVIESLKKELTNKFQKDDFGDKVNTEIDAAKRMTAASIKGFITKAESWSSRLIGEIPVEQGEYMLQFYPASEGHGPYAGHLIEGVVKDHNLTRGFQ